MRNFDDLSEREMLALAIANEEEDGRIYADFADGLVDNYPASAQVFTEMAAEENEHRRRLIDLFVAKFGEHIPLIRRQDIRGYIAAEADLAGPSAQHRGGPRARPRRWRARRRASTGRRWRAPPTPPIRKLLGDLAEVEDKHDQTGARPRKAAPDRHARATREDERERRRFILQIIQPGLVGLMDGSVSTLAPVFAAAFATHNSWNAFLVGLAASIGAGISMGFAEALADDGKLSGRGAPLLRGLVCGLMTIGGRHRPHPALPHPDFYTATVVAVCVVVVELLAIAWIQWRYMDVPPLLGRRQGDARRRAGAGGGHPDRGELKTTAREFRWRGASFIGWLLC